MVVTYVLDEEAGIVMATAVGPIATQDLLSYHDRLREDPRFRPTFHQLIDFRASTPTDIFGPQVETLLNASPFSSSSRRAYVVSAGVGYGMARMAEGISEGRLEVRAFGDIESARQWLCGLT